MNKQQTIEVLSELITNLIVIALVAAGVKYAFNFTWFQAGMIVYLIELSKTKKS